MGSQQKRIMRHIEERYGSEPEHLWAQYPDYAVYRHSASRKWYAAFLMVPRDKLGLEGTDPVCVLDLKCSPLMIGSLLSEKGFLPAYHMNKNHWISVLMDGSVADDQIFSLLEFSYDSAAPKPREKDELPDHRPPAFPNSFALYFGAITFSRYRSLPHL